MKYHAPHAIGRHSFATRMLRAGYSLHHVKESGGWATIEMVSQRYGHLAKRETAAAVEHTGSEWLAEAGIPGAKVGQSSKRSNRKTRTTR